MKNVVTDDFVQKMNDMSGQDLHWFFNEWLKEPNHPQYDNTCSIDPGTHTAVVTLNQTQHNAPFFTMPVELRFSYDTGPDSTIRVLNNVNNQEFIFTFTRNPTSVVFDPDDNIVLKENGSIVSVKQAAAIRPLSYNLDQNYPNPFNPATHFGFTIADTRLVTLKIYDVLGKEVATVLNTTMNPGAYSIPWNADALPSGIFFYRLEAGQFVQTKKMILLK